MILALKALFLITFAHPLSQFAMMTASRIPLGREQDILPD